MSLDDYLLLSFLSLWLLSYFCSPTLDDLFSTSLTMAKYSGISVVDVLCSFIGFLVTQSLFKYFCRGDQVATTSISWLIQRRSLSFNILDNTVQFSFSLRDLTSRLTVYCRDSIVLLPVKKPTASSTIELARGVLYAIIIRESLPSMVGTFMATDIIQRWMCDLAGLVALIIVLAPSLVPPGVSNVVSAIHLQEPAEVSLHEERTLIQTPSPNQKKKWIILVDRLPTPTRDRTPRRPLLPSPRSPPCSSNNSEDRIKTVVLSNPYPNCSSMNGAGLSDTNLRVTRDNPIEDSLSLEVSTPVADRIGRPSMKERDSFASGPRLTSSALVGSKSFSIAERLDMNVPEVIVEPASEEYSFANDTFSLTDMFSGEPEGNLVDERDMGMILTDVSGDDEFGFFLMPEELMINTCVPNRSLVASQGPRKLLGQVSAFDVPLVLAKSKEASTPEDPRIVSEEFTVQDNSVSITHQPEGIPLITVNAINDSYGANDTFSLTDLLSSSEVKDDLLNVQEMRDDLADVSMPEMPEPAFEEINFVEVRTDKILASAEKRGVPVAGPSRHSDALIIDKSGLRSKKRRHREHDGSDDTITKDIYTPYGLFPMAKMPYELFSPASMRASEVASALLSDEGRIRCADWRTSVDRGQQLLRVEQLAEENDKDLAEFDKMQARLRGMMREHGLETSATPPKVPNVQITQASPDSEPEKPVLDQCQVLLKAFRFPEFLEKAVPLTIDTTPGCKPSLVVSESVDSMYDPDFPGLNGKQADKYPKLNSDWPADFPTEADTSDEWKLTQEMIDFWAARKAKMEAENPPPPVNIDDLSMKVDDGGEDRTFADFEDSGEYNYEDEICLPGNSRLKCVGWRYEVVPVTPQPPQEPREHLVETVGNAILKQMYSVYSMYGKQDAEPTEEAPRSPSPPPSSPSRVVSPPLAPVTEPAPAPASASLSAASKKPAVPRRPSTSKVALTTRALRPRPSAPSKTALPPPPAARAPDPNVISKLRPRASIATSTTPASRATTEKKVASRQSLPAPKAAPRQSLAQPSAAPKASLAPHKTSKQSLAVLPKAAPRQSLHIPAPAPKQTILTPPTSIAIATLKTTSQPQPKPKTSLSAPQTQPQQTLARGVKRVPLALIQTNVPRPSLPSTTTTITRVQKSIPKLPPSKRTSLAPPPVQVVSGDAPKPLAPRPSLSRLPPRRTSMVSRR